MPKVKADPLEVLDWAALASAVGFYGWLICQITVVTHPIAGAVMGVGGCLFLIRQIDERRQQRKLRADEAKRAAGVFDRVPASASKDPTDDDEDDWQVA